MKLKNVILDCIYPRCCPICHEILPKGQIICRKCLNQMQPITQPRCMKCGKSLRTQEQEYCRDCMNEKHWFDQGIAIFPYDNKMKMSIEKFKFQGRREYGDFYVQAMAHYGATLIERWRPDSIIPVPMLPKKQKIRGFNQAEYLAEGVGQIWKIPVNFNVVKRIQGGKAQKELTARERRRNLKHAFVLMDSKLTEERILLVDDVYTTGSTIDAIAALLKANGVKKVYFMTLCQGKGL